MSVIVHAPGDDLESIRAAVEQLREGYEVLTGQRGDALDRAVTHRDLEEGTFSFGSLQDIIAALPGGGMPVVLPGTGTIPTIPDDEEPDYSTPPRLENVNATASLTTIILTWDDPGYTNWGAVEIWRAPADDLGQAIRIDTTTANIYADAVGSTGTRYYYWVRIVSRHDIEGPYHDVGGVTAQTGLVGEHDLSDMVITANKLAAGAIDALDKFIPGLEPIYNVDALPDPTDYDGPRLVFLSTDSKLYRYDGAAWTRATAASDVDGKFGTGQLEDGAVTADILAAGAVVAGKIAANAIVAGDGVIGNAAITNAQIGSLSADKLTTGFLDAARILAGSLHADKIQSGTITTTQIQAGGVHGNRITAGTLAADRIIANSITSAQIAAGGITADRISANRLSAITSYMGTVQSFNYSPGSAGFKLFEDGSAEFNNATVRGNITANAVAAGSSISAPTIVGGRIRSGQFTGYVWPTTGGGYYFGPEGLLVGNANTGGYLQWDATSATLAIGGNVNIGAPGVIKTLHVNGGAITSPVHYEFSGGGSISPTNNENPQWTSPGMPVSYPDGSMGTIFIITVVCSNPNAETNCGIKVVRNGGVIFSLPTSIPGFFTTAVSVSASDGQLTGNYTYNIQLYNNYFKGGPWTPVRVSVTVLGAKR